MSYCGTNIQLFFLLLRGKKSHEKFEIETREEKASFPPTTMYQLISVKRHERCSNRYSHITGSILAKWNFSGFGNLALLCTFHNVDTWGAKTNRENRVMANKLKLFYLTRRALCKKSLDPHLLGNVFPSSLLDNDRLGLLGLSKFSQSLSDFGNDQRVNYRRPEYIFKKRLQWSTWRSFLHHATLVPRRLVEVKGQGCRECKSWQDMCLKWSAFRDMHLISFFSYVVPPRPPVVPGGGQTKHFFSKSLCFLNN